MHNAAPLQSAASYVEDIIVVGNSFCSKYLKDFLSLQTLSNFILWKMHVQNLKLFQNPAIYY